MADKEPYLVVDDYGTGDIWFVLLATSAEQIHERLPSSTITVWAPASKPDYLATFAAVILAGAIVHAVS
jgi:hypothetical protein